MGFWDYLRGKKMTHPATGAPFFLPFEWGSNRICTESEFGQARAYLHCPIVLSVINKKAMAVKNAKFWAVDKEGNDVKKPSLVADMWNPNPYQSLPQFISMTNAFAQIFGKAYWYQIKGIGVTSSEIYVIPNTLISAKTSFRPNIDDIFKPDPDVLGYELNICGYQFPISKEDITVVSDVSASPIDLFGSPSRLISLEEPINAFMSSYEATTELMVNRGALGVLSLSDKDTAVIAAQNSPQLKSERERVQAELSRYGALKNQFKYIITGFQASFTPMSSTLNDLGTTDAQKAAAIRIADIYGVPSVLLDVEGSTYANLSDAKKILYNDAIIPEANSIMECLNKVYGNTDIKVMPFYDHLEFYQEAKRAQAAGFTALVNGINAAVAGNLLTVDEGKERLLKYEV